MLILCHWARNQTEAATVRLNIYPSCYFLLLHARYVYIITRSRKVMRQNVILNKVEFNFAHGQWNDRIIEFATYLPQVNISTFPFYTESPQNNYSCLTVVGNRVCTEAMPNSTHQTPQRRSTGVSDPSRWHKRGPEAAPSPFTLRRSSEEGRICIQRLKTVTPTATKTQVYFLPFSSQIGFFFSPTRNLKKLNSMWEYWLHLIVRAVLDSSNLGGLFFKKDKRKFCIVNSVPWRFLNTHARTYAVICSLFLFFKELHLIAINLSISVHVF